MPNVLYLYTGLSYDYTILVVIKGREMIHDVFPAKELDARLAAVRVLMQARDLDGLLASAPESIYYLTGLDHWGFFACHVLVIPRTGKMALMCRKMERITVENQVNNVDFYGHGDTEEPADYVLKILADLGLSSAKLGMEGMQAICNALKPGVTAGEVYQAWQNVADSAGLQDYRRHHCGYLVGIGFPPSWTGGSMVTSLQPGSSRILKAGMTFHAHSWFTNTDCVDYFISNTVLLTENGAEILTLRSPQTLVIR